MKKLILAFIITIAAQSSFACSTRLIDTLADQIKGNRSNSVRSIQVAVASAKACARNPQMMAYAAEKFSERLQGNYSFSVRGSEELARLCVRSPECAIALVKGIAGRIKGNYSHSVGMTKVIATIVRLNPYYSVQCEALEGISYAMNTTYSHSRKMGEIMVEISNMTVDYDH